MPRGIPGSGESETVDGNGISLVSLLQEPTEEDRNRRDREGRRCEALSTAKVLMDIVERSRPDKFAGEFWSRLDDGSKLLMFYDWYHTAGSLISQAAEIGALTAQEVITSSRAKSGVTQNIVGKSPMIALFQQAMKRMVDVQAKRFEDVQAPSFVESK